MSRIGKKVIALPKGVKVDIKPGAVEVQGPKGKLHQPLPKASASSSGISCGEALRDDPALGKFHGLARSLVANAVRGVTEGFKKELDIVGVGYRAELKGKQVHLRSATRTRSSSTSRPASTSRSRSRRTSRSPASIARRWARSRRTSAACGSRIPTSRRASATPVKC